MTVSRRRFLKYSGIGGAMVFTGGVLAACGETTAVPQTSSSSSATPGAGITPVGAVASPTAPAQPLNYTALDPKNLANFSRPLLLPGQNGLLGVLDVDNNQSFEVTAKPTPLEIFKGKSTDLLTYQVTTTNGKTVVNPIFRAKVGANFTANLTNNLGEDTTIHWHGLKVDWRMDGHPSMPVKNGSSYRYNYTVQNRGGTYWYHPHPDKLTAKQAYMGLASFYLVEDADSTRLNDQLDLKFGETDLPIVIQDKQFDTNGKLVYDTTNSNTQFMGFYGDTIMANLTPNAYLDVDTRVYRLRLLNGSNARNYRLAFVRSNDGNQKLAYWLIGTDGGLLDKPYQTSEVFLSPGERIEVLLDLSQLEAGEVVTLKSMAFDPMHREMDMMGSGSGSMGGSMSGMGSSSNTQSATNSMPTGRLDDGQEFFILKLNVKNKVSYTRAIPPTLSTLTSPDISHSPTVRPFVLSQGMMQSSDQAMQWLINGKSFKMDEYPISVKQASTEIWEFRNEAQSMPHPMHLHGFQFQVIERLNSPAQLQGLNKYDKGRMATDLGWKDTVLIWPGETVKVALNFTHNFTGEQTYLVHCHVLEHEENGMMLNYKVLEG